MCARRSTNITAIPFARIDDLFTVTGFVGDVGNLVTSLSGDFEISYIKTNGTARAQIP
jgi:hypothetical protein